MKKTLITLLLAMVAVVQAVAAVGDRFSSGNLTYTVLTEPTSSSFGTVSVYGLSSSGQSASNLSLTIPTQVVNGSSTYDVTEIRPIAFEGATNLVRVTARYGLKKIGQQAFQNCSGIKQIYLPSSLTYLAKNAFYGCDNLVRIYFAAPTPAGLTLHTDGPFPATFNTNIDVCVGYGNVNGLPLWQKYLEEYSFKSVSRNANACDVKTSSGLCLTITQAPTFSSNGKCMAVGFAPSSASDLYLNDYLYFGYGSNYRADVTQIADSALMNNTMITSVDLSGAQSLTYIGISAFEGSSITSAKVVHYGTAANRAFYNCPSLKTLTFVPRSDAVKYDIGSSVFTGNPELTTVKIEAGSVKSLSYRAFYNCPKLSSVTLGEGVQQIAGSAFQGCSSLTSLTIPASVTSLTTSVQMGTFYGCTNLDNISVNSNNTKYSSYAGALYDKAQTTLLCVPEGYINLQGFPYTLTTIGNYAFVQCKKITEQEIPYGVKTVGNYVFMNCTAMTRLHIPSSVTSLGTSVCYNCTALNTVSVNMATAPTITPGTFFYGKSQISRLYTPVGAEQDYQDKGWNIFTTVNDDHHYAYDFLKGSSGANLCYTVGATTLSGKSVEVVRGYIPASASTYDLSKYIGNMTTAATLNIPQQVSYRGNTYTLNSIGSYTFTAEGTAAPTGVLTVNLPSTVTNLGPWSFYRSRVKSLSMPGVILIGAQAFREGTLASVEFPHTLKTVDDGAFYNCSTLGVWALFPYGIAQLGKDLFSGTKIEIVVIPSSVTMMNAGIFNGAEKLYYVYLNLPANQVTMATLPSTLLHMYVPVNEVDNYKNKFPANASKITYGGYDFAVDDRYDLHYSVIDKTALTWKDKQCAGKVMLVKNPNEASSIAGSASGETYPTNLTAVVTDNLMGGTDRYLLTRLDDYCLAESHRHDLYDLGAWESIEEIGDYAFANSWLTYHIDWPDHRSDLFRVGPQVKKIGFMPFKECNMAGMFLEPASGQRSSGVFKEAGGDFVCYASYDDKYMNNLAPTNPDILSIYYQKDGVTSDAIYSPVPIDYAATAADYEGFNAFAVTGHDGDVAQAVQIESAPAGTAVMIKKNADNKPIYFKRLAQDPDWTNQTNLLWGNLNYTALHSNDYAYNTAAQQWVNANNTMTELGHGYLRRTDTETPATMTVNYIIYEPYDLNRDGKVDPDDANYVMKNGLDLDGDLAVSPDDINMIINYLLENNPMGLDYTPYLKECDANEDGFITVNDKDPMLNFLFSTEYEGWQSTIYDVNGDGWTDCWDYTILCMAVNAGIEITSYGVQVFNTTVTTLNYDDVLGDGTVSYDPETHTLTLNNANITPVGQAKMAYIVDTDNYVTYANTAVIQVNDRAIFGNYQTLNVRLIGENNIAVRDWVANNSQRIVTAFHINHNDVNIMGDGSLDISTHYGAQLATGAELKICDGAKVNFASYTAGIGIIGPNNYQSWPSTTATLTVDNAWLKVVGGTATHPIQRIAKIELIDAEYITPANAYYFDYDGTILDGDTGEYATTVEIAPTSTGLLGDVNGDGEVDVRDITALIDVIMNSITDNPRADVNEDGEIDVRDITALIDIIMNN